MVLHTPVEGVEIQNLKVLKEKDLVQGFNHDSILTTQVTLDKSLSLFLICLCKEVRSYLSSSFKGLKVFAYVLELWLPNLLDSHIISNRCHLFTQHRGFILLWNIPGDPKDLPKSKLLIFLNWPSIAHPVKANQSIQMQDIPWKHFTTIQIFIKTIFLYSLWFIKYPTDDFRIH